MIKRYRMIKKKQFFLINFSKKTKITKSMNMTINSFSGRCDNSLQQILGSSFPRTKQFILCKDPPKVSKVY